MTALKAHEVEGFLARPDISPGVFLVYGPDAGLVRETAQRLVQRFGAGDPDAVTTLDGAELGADPGRLAVEARTPSLFGDRRVLRVRDAGKALVPPLAALLEDGVGAAIVLEAGNLLPRDPLRALVERAAGGWTLPCYADSEADLRRLITQSLSEAGIVADSDALEELRDSLGNDREVTRRELEKLVLFASRSRRLTRADIQALCADNAVTVVDQIVDMVGTGHAARLEEALDRALAAAVAPQQVLTATGNHFAALRRWRGLVDAGRSPRDVLGEARPRPHFSRRGALEQQLRLWRDDALAMAGERLHLAAAESRRRYALQETIVRRALLAVCMLAAER